jgi:hypothetical protein
VSVHVPDAWGDEIDALSEAMSAAQAGITVTKADVMRGALRLGLDALTEKYGSKHGKPRRGG